MDLGSSCKPANPLPVVASFPKLAGNRGAFKLLPCESAARQAPLQESPTRLSCGSLNTKTAIKRKGLNKKNAWIQTFPCKCSHCLMHIGSRGSSNFGSALLPQHSLPPPQIHSPRRVPCSSGLPGEEIASIGMLPLVHMECSHAPKRHAVPRDSRQLKHSFKQSRNKNQEVHLDRLKKQAFHGCGRGQSNVSQVNLILFYEVIVRKTSAFRLATRLWL